MKGTNDEGGKETGKSREKMKGEEKGRQGHLVENTVGFIWIAQ